LQAALQAGNLARAQFIYTNGSNSRR
jgi:hypothetical protein